MAINNSNAHAFQLEERIIGLRDQIRRAFQSSITSAIDDSITDCLDDERVEITRAFSGRAWGEINTEFLKRRVGAWCFFTPLAYTTFLPAYLLASLEYYRQPDSVEDSIMVGLIPPVDPDPRRMKWFNERSRGFSAEQCDVIASWIEFQRDLKPSWHDPDDIARAIKFFARQAEQLRMAKDVRDPKRHKRLKRKKANRERRKRRGL